MQVLHPPNVIIVMACVGIIDLPFQSAIIIAIVEDIIFALTRLCDEFFYLHLQFLDRFLLSVAHGESELSCNYDEITRK